MIRSSSSAARSNARTPRSRSGRTAKTPGANLTTHVFGSRGRPYSVKDWEAAVRLGHHGFNEVARRVRAGGNRYGGTIKPPRIYHAGKAGGGSFHQMYRQAISGYCWQVGISLVKANLAGLDLRG